MAGWLAGWLVGWVAGWLVGWLAGWLVGSLLAGWLVGWRGGWLVILRAEAGWWLLVATCSVMVLPSAWLQMAGCLMTGCQSSLLSGWLAGG